MLDIGIILAQQVAISYVQISKKIQAMVQKLFAIMVLNFGTGFAIKISMNLIYQKDSSGKGLSTFWSLIIHDLND